MKFYTRWVHHIVRQGRLENFFVALGRMIPLFHRFLPLPSEYPPQHFITVERDGVIFKIDRSDYMQWHLYAGLPDVSWTKALSVLPSGGMVLDVGANCGQFALKLAAALVRQGQPCEVHAFEPNTKIFQLLSLNRDNNIQLSGVVHCHALAIGKEPGTMAFSYNPANSGGGSLQPAAVGIDQQPVKIETLDRIVESLSLAAVHFVKIDVEGYEPEVLLGGASVIRKFHPWIYVEITPSWFEPRGYKVKQIMEMLVREKYELLGEKEGEFIPYLKNEQLFLSLHQFNLLAKPTSIGD